MCRSRGMAQSLFCELERQFACLSQNGLSNCQGRGVPLLYNSQGRAQCGTYHSEPCLEVLRGPLGVNGLITQEADLSSWGDLQHRLSVFRACRTAGSTTWIVCWTLLFSPHGTLAAAAPYPCMTLICSTSVLTFRHTSGDPQTWSAL